MKYLTLTTIAMLVAVSAWATGAQAPQNAAKNTSYYVDQNFEVFINQLDGGGEVAVIYDTAKKQAGAFRFENIDANSQAGLQMGALKSGILGVNPNFEPVFTSNSINGYLDVKAVGAGQKIGCPDSLHLEESYGAIWAESPMQTGSYFNNDGSAITIRNEVLDGQFKIGDVNQRDSLMLSPLFNSFYNLRPFKIDLEVARGRSLDRTLSALAVPVNRKGAPQLLIMQVQASSSSCMTDATLLNWTK